MKLLRLGGVLVLVVALYGGWLLLRDAPLFKVDKVQVNGLAGPVTPEVRARLKETGLGMTTTHVDVGALDQAVAPYTVVKGLRVHTDFPHGLRITVIEQLPIATMVVGQTRLGIAADGSVVHGLGGTPDGLPSFTATELPTTNELRDAAGLRALEVVDIAPAALRKAISRIGPGPGGLTAYLRNGPSLYFGDTSRLHAKWAAAARVLADPQSRGASYLDVRLPDRPAAGINDPATSGTAGTGQVGTAGAPLVAAQAPGQPSTSSGG